MFYDYICTHCGATTTVKASMAEGHEAPVCLEPLPVADLDLGGNGVTMSAHGAMRRVYGALGSTIQWSMSDYYDKAYRGEEAVPSLSLTAVRTMIDNDVRHSRKGRVLDARRAGERQRSLRRRTR